MTVFLLLSAIVLGFLFEKSKVVSAYIVSAMYMLAAFNYQNADYYTYTISYANSASPFFNYRYLGYSMFVHFFSSRGLTYSQYLKIAFIPIFIILFVAICYLTDRPNRVLALFLIFPFGIDVVQLKALFSEMFGLIGIAFIINNVSEINKFKQKQKYILAAFFFVLSVLFHFSGLFYVAVTGLFVCFREKKWFPKAVIAFSLLGLFAVMTGLLSKTISFASSLGIVSEADYLSNYALKTTRLGFVVTFIPVLLMVGSSLFITSSRKEKNTKKQLAIRQFLLTILLILPLLVMHMVFDRLARVYIILLYILFVNAPKCSKITIKQVCSYVMFFVSIVWFFYIDIYSFWDSTLLSILKYSELF